MKSTVVAIGNSSSLIARGDIKDNKIVFNILENSLEYASLKEEKAKREQWLSALKEDKVEAIEQLETEIDNIEKKIAVYTERVRTIVQKIDEDQDVALKDKITQLLKSQRLDEALQLIPDEDLKREEIQIETRNKSLA